VPLDLGMRFQLPVFLSFQRDAMMRWPVRAALDFLRMVVFDRKLMPWFGDQYEAPSRRWKELFNDILAQAQDPTRPIGDNVPNIGKAATPAKRPQIEAVKND
jgi:hypothetical protein